MSVKLEPDAVDAIIEILRSQRDALSADKQFSLEVLDNG